MARKAIELGAQQGVIPFFVPLGLGHWRPRGADTTAVVGLKLFALPISMALRLPTSLYIFDGFDELPAARLDDFIREFNRLSQDEPGSRILLTPRQAFFVGRQRHLPQPFELFYILDFSDDDVDAVIRHTGVDGPAFRDNAGDPRTPVPRAREPASSPW